MDNKPLEETTAQLKNNAAELEATRAELKRLDNLRKLDPQNQKLITERNKLAGELGEPYIIVKTATDPRLDPNSPDFSQEEWNKYIDSIDWSGLDERMKESMANFEKLTADTTQVIMQIMEQLDPSETIDAAFNAIASVAENFRTIEDSETIDAAFNAIASVAENFRTIEDSGLLHTILNNISTRLIDLSPEELEALQADINEEKLDKALEEHKDQLQLPEFEAETKKRKKRANSGKALAAFTEKVAEETTSLILQNAATNMFSKIKIDKKNAKIDPITGTATLTSGDMKITITHFAELAGLNTSTQKLLKALTKKFTQDPHKNRCIVLPLAEYMEKRGLKDRKSAREQAVKDLDTLFNASISFTGEGGKSGINFVDMRICEEKGMANGKILFTMSTRYAQMLINGQIMPFPMELLQTNDNKNPHSFYLGCKIAELKNMNAGREREDIISVKTLLASCPNMPSYEEVMRGSGNIYNRIIEPFERDMDALGNLFKWNLCHSKGEPLTQAELDNLNYDIFINCLVKINWRDYPDQTKRLEERQKKIDKAIKSKEKPKRKPKAKKTAESV